MHPFNQILKLMIFHEIALFAFYSMRNVLYSCWFSCPLSLLCWNITIKHEWSRKFFSFHFSLFWFPFMFCTLLDHLKSGICARFVWWNNQYDLNMEYLWSGLIFQPVGRALMMRRWFLRPRLNRHTPLQAYSNSSAEFIWHVTTGG